MTVDIRITHPHETSVENHGERGVVIVPPGQEAELVAESSEELEYYNWYWAFYSAGGSGTVVGEELHDEWDAGIASGAYATIKPYYEYDDLASDCIKTEYKDGEMYERYIGLLVGEPGSGGCPACPQPEERIPLPGGEQVTPDGPFKYCEQCGADLPTRQGGVPLTVTISGNDKPRGNLGKGVNISGVRQLFRYSDETDAGSHYSIRDEIRLKTEGGGSLAFWKNPDSYGWSSWSRAPVGLITYYEDDEIYEFHESVPGEPAAEWRYDAYGHAKWCGDETGNTTYFQYDAYAPEANLKKIITENQDVVYFDYSGDNVDKVRVVPAGSSDGRTTYFTFDGSNHLEAIKHPGGCVTYYEWEGGSRLIGRKDGENWETYFTYDPGQSAAKPSKIDYPDGSWTYFEHNAASSRTTVTDPDGNATQYTYNRFGKATAIKDARGNTATYEYDDTGYKTREINRRGYPTYYEPDAYGNVTRQTDALQHTTYYTYDYGVLEGGALTEEKDARDNTTYYAYDANGNRTKTTDALDRTTYYTYDSYGMMVSEKDPRENTTYYEYNTRGLMTSSTDPVDNTTYYRYNGFGDQTEVTDARDHTTYYEHDDAGRVTKVTDTLGNSTETGYDSRGLVDVEIDQRDNETEYEYDPMGRMARQIDALDRTTYYAYDLRGNQASVKDPRGNVTTMAYNELNRLSSQTDALNHATYYHYDENGNQTLVTDARGNQTQTRYDELDRPIATYEGGSAGWGRQAYGVTPYGDGGLGQLRSSAYDEVGNLTKTTDALDNPTYFYYDELNRQFASRDALDGLTYFEFDKAGNQTASIDARDHATYFYYDPANRQKGSYQYVGGQKAETYYEFDEVGNTTISVDARGHATCFVYDELNRQQKVMDALEQETYFGYDEAGNQILSIDARQNATYFYYDALNRQKGSYQFLDGQKLETYFEFDQNGNVTDVYDPRGGRVQSVYDEVNRVTSLTDQENGSSYFGYDEVGNATRVTHAAGQTTYFGYDSLDRLEWVRDPEQACVCFGYDLGSDLVESVSNGRGYATYFGYDALSRPTDETDPNLCSTYYSYDPNGNLLKRIDNNARWTYFHYDELNRLTCREYQDGASAYFSYDAKGNITQFADSWGTHYFQYDAVNRLTKRTWPSGRWFSRTYDAVGNVTAIGGNAGTVVYYSYDEANNVTVAEPADGPAAYYSYDEVGNVVKAVRPGVAVSYFTYDLASRTTSIHHVKDDGTPIAYFDYTYRADGQVTRLGREDSSHVYYEYDANDRLTKEDCLDSGGQNIYAFAYNYDPAGNRTYKSANGVQTYYEYSPADELQRKHELPADTWSYYSYDPNGSLAKIHKPSASETTYFAYNDIPLLEAIKYPDGTLNYFHYDGQSRRYAVEDSSGTYYLYDDGLNPLSKVDASHTVLESYANGPTGVPGIGTPITIDRAEVHVPLFDVHGNLSAAINTDGNIDLLRQWSAFGENLGKTGTLEVDFGYQANWRELRDWPGPTKWPLSPTRPLAPEDGRYVARDPLGHLAGMNLYEYASSAPCGLVDPIGLKATKEQCICWAKEYVKATPALPGLEAAALEAFRAHKQAAARAREELLSRKFEDLRHLAKRLESRLENVRRADPEYREMLQMVEAIGKKQTDELIEELTLGIVAAPGEAVGVALGAKALEKVGKKTASKAVPIVGQIKTVFDVLTAGWNFAEWKRAVSFVERTRIAVPLELERLPQLTKELAAARGQISKIRTEVENVVAEAKKKYLKVSQQLQATRKVAKESRASFEAEECEKHFPTYKMRRIYNIEHIIKAVGTGTTLIGP